jgi:hypothetical protein
LASSKPKERRGLDLLEKKIRQMHAALDGLGTDDLSAIQPQIEAVGTRYVTRLDFNQNSDEIALANATSLLIANIACIKDHLKVWCAIQGVQFLGEDLINKNMAVGLIHDLWNIDKHAELNRPPRSGCKPKLQNIRTVLSMSSGTAAGSGVMISVDPLTGKMKTSTFGGGTALLTLAGDITDETGQTRADFTQTCTDAIEAWSNTLRMAGVPLPKSLTSP